ncbi:MAG: metallophosphoesterase family protein [Anaerolineae bacterium]
MKSETWNLKYVVVAGIVLVSLVACLPATPVPLTLIPPSTATQIVTFTPAPPPTFTPTPSSTSTLTSSPTSTPTVAPAPSPTFTPVPTPDVAIVRGPYLQSVTTSTIIVAWETDLPSHGAVAYGETEEYGASVADATTGTRHAVTLTGLAPYTTYHYRVESSGVPLSEDGYETIFRTAADPDQDSFTFVAFGDTRTQHQFHQAVVERIVEAQPDFVLHTGDLVAMGSASPHWETFFEIEWELMARVPLFPALGNHEVNHSRYFDLFYLPGNERWYTFDYGNARFVCLQVDGIADFGPGSEQHTWLEETLAANTQPWLFVYFHIPPYSSVQDNFEHYVRQTLTPLFERYGVDVVFNGHRHNYERSEVNGVTYVVTGGGGAPLYAMQEREPAQVAFALAYHFVLLEINGQRLEATVISSTGEVLDEFGRSADW